MKTLTKDIVLNIAEGLMEINGNTTTLEVKNELRFQGYFAIQKDISFAMDALCYQYDWTFIFNGSFRIYLLNKKVGSSHIASGFSLN
ncbi:hypothetical protein R9C00_11665 [Flammeovirgaceae bacterium SG7u.111]|nr:hypothetical protein [Flammeovirgaceae bacterium SG7u.132]WPO38110.1 hypothetical protein R9C00_11665 [Flammeovirgaceae bacterium SG7u.111]